MLFGSLLVVRSGERQEPAPEGESPREWQQRPLMLDARLQMPSETVRAIQPAELSTAFLHSEGTFVVVTGEQTFVWIGKVRGVVVLASCAFVLTCCFFFRPRGCFRRARR